MGGEGGEGGGDGGAPGWGEFAGLGGGSIHLRVEGAQTGVSQLSCDMYITRHGHAICEGRAESGITWYTVV